MLGIEYIAKELILTVWLFQKDINSKIHRNKFLK